MKQKTFSSKLIRIDHRGIRVPIKHLHLNIQTVLSDADRQKIQDLIDTSAYPLKWNNFTHPGLEEVTQYFKKKNAQPLTSKEIAILEKLVDPKRSCSPLSLLTSHYCGPQYGENYEKYIELERQCSLLLNDLSDLKGYLEQETVWFRDELIPEQQEMSLPWSECDQLSVRPWELIDLVEIGEPFRQTEYHITFDDVAFVDMRVLNALASLPHYFAWKESSTSAGVKYSFIVTVQGFNPEIEVIMAKVWPWVKIQMLKGRIKTAVVIKPEYIESFDVRDARQQLIVKPGSLI